MQQDYKDTQFSESSFFSSLKGRLITFFLAVSLVPLVLVGLLTYNLARAELRSEALNKLETVRDAKLEEINTYFDAIERDLQLVSELDIVSEAYRVLSSALYVLGFDEARNLEFMGDPTMAEPETLNAYSLAHAKYYDLFSNIVQAREYTDLLLVSRTGDIVYTYAKQDDFATNLLDGPYQDTRLAELFRTLKDEAEPGEVFMTDYAPYPPAGNIPVSFVGTSLIDRVYGAKGIIIYEMPINLIDDLMIKENAAGGLADIKIYLVDPTDRRVLSTAGFSGDGIFANTLAVAAGQQARGTDDSSPILTAYRPLERLGVKWVLLAEQTEEKATEAVGELSYWMWGMFIVTAVLVVGLGLVVAFRIANPISHLINVAQRIIGGDLEAKAQVESQDETGQLAQAFNTMTAQLRQSIGSLEEQVQERTAELAASVEIGQQATAIRNLDELLSTITEFIQNRFNIYYTQVFLVDDVNQNLVLYAGTDQAGQELVARNFSLPIDAHSAVGQAAIEGRPVIIRDTTLGSIDTSQHIPAEWYSVLIKKAQAEKPASLLPKTASELTIPLIVQEQVIGVLDLQDDKLNTFTRDNLNVYEAMAVQLAIAIDSARQWALTQEAHKRAEEAIRQLTREAWAERLASRKDSAGFVYDLSRIASLLPDAYSLTAAPENGCSAPLVVQDQTIGYLSVRTPGDRDLTEDERVLLQAVAQQLAQKAENLRLFEATQQRASREQIARQIIDRVRASRNIEMALRTAAEELNKTLNTARASIDLQIAPHPQPIPAEEQNTDSAGVKTAPDVSSVNDSLDEVSLLRRYGHSGLL